MLGIKRPAESLLQSDNPKTRASPGSSLDMLAACTSQWIQSLPSDARAQGLGALGAVLNGGAGSLPVSLFGRTYPNLQLQANPQPKLLIDPPTSHAEQLSSLLATPLRAPLPMVSNRPGGHSLVQQLQGSLPELPKPGISGFVPLQFAPHHHDAQRAQQHQGAPRPDAQFGNYSSALASSRGAHSHHHQQLLLQPEAAYNKYCHFCQHVKVKRADSMFACQNKHCSRRFCDNCLKVHLAVLIKEDQAARQPWDPAWSCPVCRKTCCCSIQDCKKDHRHCKAFRYRRRRAEVTPKSGQPKRASDNGEGPSLETDTLSPEGPEVSPMAGPRKSPVHKASIEAMLNSEADTNVWLTPTFWARPSGEQHGAPTEILESSCSDSSSPAPSEASAKSPHMHKE